MCPHLKFKNACFEFYSETIVRMRYSPSGSFTPYPPIICGEKLPLVIKCRVEKRKETVVLSTSAITLEYTNKNTGFNEHNLRISFEWGGVKGECRPPFNDDKNLGGTVRALDRWPGIPKDWKEEKGVLSRNGFHVLENKCRVYWNPVKEWPEVIKEQGSVDFFFFAYGKDYQRALQDFVNVFGKIPMPPVWAFGFWYSRWYPYKDREFVEIIKKYRRLNIPIDVMVIDSDWRVGGWWGYEWNRKYFPNPGRTMKEIHELGCNLCLNDHPGYDRIEALPWTDPHIRELKKIFKEPTVRGEWGCDWSKKSVVDAFGKIYLKPFFKQGMDFWWVDGWAEPPFEGVDPQLFVNMQYFKLRESETKKRGLILSRWGGIGSHKYPLWFSGDVYSNWETLKYEICFTVKSGNLGAIYWSHDIGGLQTGVPEEMLTSGFLVRKISEELFIRWVQFGALSPIFRTHSAHGIREPWNYSRKVLAIFRQYTKLRCALLPYFYTLAREAYDTGMPLVRALYLHYPEEEGAYNAVYEYLLGKDMLVVPADGPMRGNRNTFSKNAYFPGDKWIDIYTGEIIEGIKNKVLRIPLDRLPIFVRSGAIIPYYEEMKFTREKKNPLIHFDIFSEGESHFELYEDDGDTLAYQKGTFNRIKINALKRGNIIGITINNKQKIRDYSVNIMLGENEMVDKVLCDKKTIPFKITTKCAAGLIDSQIKFCNISIKGKSQIVSLQIILIKSRTGRSEGGNADIT
jgi:alpha-glucosidase (family GH31 glycosyl hydrolase)